MSEAGALRLWEEIDTRRVDLDLTWEELAERAAVSRQTFLNIRAGRVPRKLTCKRIEDALGWVRGSVDAILRIPEGKPSLVGELPELASRVKPKEPKPVTLDPLKSSPEEIAEFLEDVRQYQGEEAFQELFQQTLHVTMRDREEHERATLGQDRDVQLEQDRDVHDPRR